MQIHAEVGTRGRYPRVKRARGADERHRSPVKSPDVSAAPVAEPAAIRHPAIF